MKKQIIILGNPKSGTSVIAHLLADFGDLSKTIDIPPIWPPTAVDIMLGRLSFNHFIDKNVSLEPSLDF